MLSPNHGLPTRGTDRGPFKVVRKFPYGNFLPPKVKNPALSLRGFSAALLDTCSRFLEFALQILLNNANARKAATLVKCVKKDRTRGQKTSRFFV